MIKLVMRHQLGYDTSLLFEDFEAYFVFEHLARVIFSHKMSCLKSIRQCI